MAVGEVEYQQLVAAVDGLALTWADHDRALAEARRRGDGATEVMLLLLAGMGSEGEGGAYAVALGLAAAARRELVVRLAGWRDEGVAWHLLVALAEAYPEDLPLLETALASWSDSARQMPHAWWVEIGQSRWAPWHRLVRELMVRGDEIGVLLRPGVEQSLGAIMALGVEDVDPSRLVTLLGSPVWSGVTRLVLRGVDWTGPAGDVLAATAGFQGVGTLTLSGGLLPAPVLAELLVGASFPALTLLEVAAPSTPQPSDRRYPGQVVPAPVPLVEVARAVDTRPVARQRFELELCGLGVDADGVRALAAAPVLAGLRGLAFTFSELTADDVAVLAAAEADLERFTLHLGETGPAGAHALAGARWRRRLRYLELPNQGLGDAGTAELIRALDGGPLHTLILPHNKLGSLTVAALGEVALPALHTLDLSYNRIDDRDLARALANPRLGQLRVVELLGTGFGIHAARALVGHTCLQTVNLGDTVGDQAAAVLGQARWPELRRLQLRGVSDAAIAELRPPGCLVTNARFA